MRPSSFEDPRSDNDASTNPRLCATDRPPAATGAGAFVANRGGVRFCRSRQAARLNRFAGLAADPIFGAMKALLVVLATLLVAAGTCGQEYQFGGVTEFTVTLGPEDRRTIGRGQTSRTDRALCAVALPHDFDPSRTWPILIVSSTSDPGYNSSRTWLRERYADAGIAAGWIVVAADPPTPQPPALDLPELRYVLARAALNHLARRWPGFAEWPVACGGFSGGSKHSVHVAAQAAREGRAVIGLFLGGCNEDVSYTSFNLHNPPRRSFRRVPVFLSGGEGDRVAPPASQTQVEASLRSNGFTRVRRESYPGVHEFHAAHLTEALAWFRELYLPVGASADAPLPR